MPTTLVVRERKTPRESHVLIRGDFLRLGAIVTGGVPDFLPPLPPSKERPTRIDLAQLAVRSGQSPHGPRDRQPRVATFLWHGIGRHRKRLRDPGLAPHASRAPRLARRRIDAVRLEPKTPAPLDRHVGNLSAVVGNARRSVAARSGQPLACAAIAASPGSGIGPRRGTHRERSLVPQDRRTQRLPAAARGLFCDHAAKKGVARKPGARPLSPRHVHLLLAQQPVPDVANI